jgi:hypothetical protein
VCSIHGSVTSVDKSVVGIPEEKRQFRRQRRRLEENSNTGLGNSDSEWGPVAGVSK